MVEIEYVIRKDKPLFVSQEAIIDVAKLYKHVKSFFDKHEYDFYEKEYIDELKESGKDSSIKWETEKKVDDYVKFHIEIRIRFYNLRDVEGKKGLMNKGKVSFRIEAFIEKDYEQNWETSFMARFWRGVYDNFVIKGKLEQRKKDLLDESYEVFNEIKSFLNLHRYKS